MNTVKALVGMCVVSFTMLIFLFYFASEVGMYNAILEYTFTPICIMTRCPMSLARLRTFHNGTRYSTGLVIPSRYRTLRKNIYVKYDYLKFENRRKEIHCSTVIIIFIFLSRGVISIFLLYIINMFHHVVRF